jgi:biopolymer transport protein ExbD
MASKHKRKRVSQGGGDIEMTPMIDVVFQLLVYFIVTIKPVDVSAHLDVFRPAADSKPKEVTTPPKMIQIQIYQGALLMNGRSVDMDGLSRILEKLGAISTTQTVMIMCSRDSDHDSLVQVLDRCSKTGLTNLSVASMN